jgi:ABC-type uncharacterized transport system ATPase subunit
MDTFQELRKRVDELTDRVVVLEQGQVFDRGDISTAVDPGHGRGRADSPGRGERAA